MKIMDLFEKTEDSSKGTYAAARFSKDSKDILMKFIKDNKIINPTKTDKLHSTLLYSRAFIKDYTAVGKYEDPIECKPVGFEIWESQPDEKTKQKSKCLVLKLNAPEFKARHKELMTKHKEATYDYDEFKVHVTLSYDVGPDFKVDELPAFNDVLFLDEEYGTDLDLNWAKNNSVK